MCIRLLLIIQVSYETLSLSILSKLVPASPASVPTAHLIFFIVFLSLPNYVTSVFNHLPQ